MARSCGPAVILALGGASWAKLGSDAAWVSALEGQGAAVAPFRAANCGFDVAWSAVFRERFAGEPLKNIGLRHGEKARGATPWSPATAWRAGQSTPWRLPCATRSRPRDGRF
jgi:predicted flavoprotein YhiN